MNYLKELVYRIRGEYTTERLVNMGMKIGENFKRLNNVILDPSHCWLIEIGNNVTLAPRVHILCHDASTKMFLGYTKIGKVTIGNNVFVGAETVILPGVSIGSNVIIGANSTITHDVPDNVVVIGSPGEILCSLDEYLNKEKMNLKKFPCYGEDYTLKKNISIEKKNKQKEELIDNKGFIV